MRHLPPLLLLLVCSCSVSISAPQAASGPDTLRKIQELIGPASCSEQSQCKTLMLGVKACGGPERYLAWSTAHASAEQLAPLALRLKAERQAQLAASGELSDCRAMTDPGALCLAGRCVLGTGAFDPR